MPQPISDRDWQEWAHHPMTMLWAEQIREDLQDMKDCWARGGYTTANSDELLQANAQAIGAAQTLQSMLDKIEELRRAAQEQEQ